MLKNVDQRHALSVNPLNPNDDFVSLKNDWIAYTQGV